jgi:hypothetical protein
MCWWLYDHPWQIPPAMNGYQLPWQDACIQASYFGHFQKATNNAGDHHTDGIQVCRDQDRWAGFRRNTVF